MARTVGIIFSAVIVFTAGLVTFLFGAMTMHLAVLNERGTASAPGGYFAIPLAIILIVLGGLGVPTGVAIVKMKVWARSPRLLNDRHPRGRRRRELLTNHRHR
jgi:hypothetical protein